MADGGHHLEATTSLNVEEAMELVGLYRQFLD